MHVARSDGLNILAIKALLIQQVHSMSREAILSEVVVSEYEEESR